MRPLQKIFYMVRVRLADYLLPGAGSTCPDPRVVFQEDLNSNLIHLEDDRKVCVGPFTPGARPVYMQK